MRTILTNTAGLILCGGRGQRLGMDKMMLSFHNKPQYQFLYEMMENESSLPLISCREDQSAEMGMNYKTVLDDPDFYNAGPMTGILSVHRKYPELHLLVVACDYPYFTAEDLEQFKQTVKQEELTLFYNKISGFYEPVLGYYPVDFLNELEIFYNSGGRSIQTLLPLYGVTAYQPANPLIFTNINTPEDLEKYRASKI